MERAALTTRRIFSVLTSLKMGCSERTNTETKPLFPKLFLALSSKTFRNATEASIDATEAQRKTSGIMALERSNVCKDFIVSNMFSRRRQRQLMKFFLRDLEGLFFKDALEDVVDERK